MMQTELREDVIEQGGDRASVVVAGDVDEDGDDDDARNVDLACFGCCRVVGLCQIGGRTDDWTWEGGAVVAATRSGQK